MMFVVCVTITHKVGFLYSFFMLHFLLSAYFVFTILFC